MSHEIDMSNRRANMGYVGEAPWHGLGKKLTEGAPIEIWMREAGLAWKLLRSRVRFSVERDIATERDMLPAGNIVQFATERSTMPASTDIMEGRMVLFRDDTKEPLSIVSDTYKIVQPGEVLEFYRDLVAAAGWELETAGSLDHGRRYWALAKRQGMQISIMGQDVLKGYLLLATSCDGSLATTAKFTSVRVVCQNTLHIATADGSPAIRVPHSVKFNALAVKQDLGLADKSWEEFGELCTQLANRKVDKKEALQWLLDSFGDSEEPVEEQSNARIIKGVWEAVKNSPGNNLRSADGTAWGLVNGATYFFDHVRNTRTQDARLNRAWFGDGAAFKASAFEHALRLVA